MSRTGPSGANDVTSARSDMRQVAALAGVAMSSVSRVLSQHPDVSKAMRTRVLAAVDELGYEPNMLAQMLRRGETQTIGFVVGDISNPLLAQIALGAEVTLRSAGYALLLANSGHEANGDANHIRLLQQRRVDGLLMSVSDETNEQTLDALRRNNTPSVLIDRTVALTEPPSAVLSDHATGIRQAVERLAAMGHTRIALVAGSAHVRPTRERTNALEEAADSLPGVVAQVRAGAFTEAHGMAATRELLSSRRPPTAIIAGGNQILVGVLAQLRASKLKIPRDVSLVTCDDVPLAKYFTPALSIIERDPYEMGRVAAELLLERLRGEAPRTVILPTAFRPRDSSAAPRSTPPASPEGTS